MLPAVNKIWLWYSISSILITFPGSISANQVPPLIPPAFDKICRVQQSAETIDPIRIHCELSSHDNQTWSLNSLREWIASSENNQSNVFSYSLTCGPSGGSLSVPWPMKCQRLVELTIRNCRITDIFSDFQKDVITNIPPQLTKLEITNSAMVIKYSNLLRMYSELENITSDYDCLHDKTVEKITFRNVSYDLENDVMEDMIRCAAKHLGNGTDFGALTFPQPPPGNRTGEADPSGTTEMPQLSDDVQGTEQSSDDKICEMLDIKNIVNLPQRLRDLEVSCHYEKLRYLDDSISSTLSVYHHRFLTKYSHFPFLEFLNYSYNNIDVIPPELSDWSFYFKVLKYMDLSHNRIHTLNFKSAFTGDHVNDTFINVQYNNITTLTPDDLGLLKKLRKTFIDIQNNPIHCDCELRDFIDAISKPDTFTGSLKKYDYIRNMVCHFPLSLKGRQLKSLTVDDLGCESNTWIVPFVVLAVIAVILFTLVLLAFIYRREIRILFYTRLNIHIPGTVYVGLGPKSYHAFVSYSNEDEDWVLDVLCKQLEDPTSIQSQDSYVKSTTRKSKKLKQFKLCLHARDFVPGMTIIENIINSVEKSRHTIIVLTANFVQSKWAMEEFFQAYQQSVLERRRHLIIVIRGDLPEETMDPVLKRCLKTFTYLKASDKIFYDRLAYSLSTENRMTKEETSKEEEILKSRKKTVSVDMPQENDSGIFITSEESLTGLSGQYNTQTSVISITNSDMGLIEATHL